MADVQRVDMDRVAIDVFLNDPAGPVAQLLIELAEEVATVARGKVHRRPGTRSSATTGRTSNARPPGFTRASINPQLRVHGGSAGLYGRLYSSVEAAADPAVFLEDPAEQLHEKYPFLTTGLDSIQRI